MEHPVSERRRQSNFKEIVTTWRNPNETQNTTCNFGDARWWRTNERRTILFGMHSATASSY